MSNPSPSRSPRLEDATLRDWVEHWAIETPAAPAVLSEVGNIDYGGLHAKALALAVFLRDLGIGPGDILAVQLPNTLEFVLTYLASGYVGATLQTIHMPYRSGEIEPLLRHSRAKGIVCLAKARDVAPAEIVLSLKRTVLTLQHVIAHGDGAPPSAWPFPELSGTPVGRPLPTPASSDRFLLLYTSGTTSAPKGVPIAYRNFLPNAALSARELKIDNRSILLSAAPFSHLYGLFSVKLVLATGAATALLPVFSPPALAGALERYRPTGMFVGPAHMAACLNEGLLTPDRMASLKFALISGSTCPLALARAVQERTTNGQVLQLWGMSEMQAGTFTRPSDSEVVRFETAGRASPGTELRIANDEMPVPAGTEGELQARGPSVFSGYLDNAAATADAFTADGWFRTGDLARLDPAGNLQITGRLKDVINRGGVKFNLADVEVLIEQHPAVAACAIVPVPDPVLGERACCFAVLKPGADNIALADLTGWLTAKNVAKIKWPERLELIAEMPMTPTRKIMKGELTRRAAALK
jgi:cyclohexanecarboxylate-CoA ligase